MRAFVWEIPFLASLAAFMFWLRMVPFRALIAPEAGRVYFIGSTDPFYHFRTMISIVRNFPSGTRWDPWTQYPLGTATGQFGTLFDWLPAAWVVLTHGKGASEYDIAIALSVYTAIIGSIIIVPFYFLAKRFFGTFPAIAATITLALLPGGFFRWGLATAGDHHGAEALGSVISMLGVYYAAERSHALRHLIRRGANLRTLWPVALAGVLGGVALAVNILLWPPALLFAAVLTAWLTVVILLENAKEGGDARGLATGGAISLGLAGLIMVPVIDTTFLGEFNTYGLLHVLACLFAAVWIVGVHSASRLEVRHGLNPWTVPGIVAGAAVVVFLFVRVFVKNAFAGIAWGLSWISGIGTPRTTATIGEARPTAFFCSDAVQRAGQNCLRDEYGILPAVTFLILIAVIIVALWKRDRADILLAIWAFVIFRAVDTQSRFSYYLAVVMALLIGWLAARLATVGAIFTAPAATKRVKRGTRKVEEPGSKLPLQVGAAVLALLVVLPGNVFATEGSNAAPTWVYARAYSGVDPTMALWLDGLDWMRANTPDAGVDLGKIYHRPAEGELFSYPPESYGVLSWWDYGHWIETWGKRPPVANPFQQAAPFASTWLTERSPARAEELLTEWERGAMPVRYVFISSSMATSIYQPITYWANLHNDSRPLWPGGDSITGRDLLVNGKTTRVPAPGPGYTETMMGRLFDRDADSLEHYRLVYEHPRYIAVGSIVNDDGSARCVHDTLDDRPCFIRISNEHLNAWRSDPSRAVALGQDAHAYDIELQSSLKLFERVEGARLQGTAAPGTEVIASALIELHQVDGRARAWEHEVRAVAGPDGRFELVWAYPTTGFLSPGEGGTATLTKPEGGVTIRAGGLPFVVDVTERQVIDGGIIEVMTAP